MQYELHSDGSLTELPQQNIDTGLGLDRMAAIQQDVPSVYETEHFRPLVEFGEERSGRRYGQDEQTTRSERLLAELIERARAIGAQEVAAEDAFRLHDTYGFPFEMTQEVLTEEGLTVDEQGFAALMEQARDRARSGARDTGGDQMAERAAAFARQTGFSTRFVGYESTEADTVARAVASDNGAQLVKLEDSPFYPAGGGQVSDSGLVRTGSAQARVDEVFRLGDDQVLALEPGGGVAEGEEVHAEVDRPTRLATMRNHTATHLLHAALRERLGDHVRQAGSY